MKLGSAVRRLVVLFFLVCQTNSLLIAQNRIPLGTWRMHLSFNELLDVAVGGNTIYAAAPNGILLYHKDELSFEVFHKGNGLSSTGITALAFDPLTSQLLIAYEGGTFDAIQDNKVLFYDPSRNTVLTGSRKINHISTHEGQAYFSTDYGVLVFDLQRREIKETWRDLGDGGSTLEILGSTFFNDSVFLATREGIIAGKLTENLLDFNKWRRFDEAGLNGPVKTIATFNNAVYAGVNETGVFSYQQGVWQQEPFLQGEVFQQFNASSEYLLITGPENIWLLNADNELESINTNSDTNYNEALEDQAGTIWIAHKQDGLLSNSAGSFLPILPNGPSMNNVTDLVYRDNKIFALSGGFSSSFEPLRQKGDLNIFENGIWETQEIPMSDLTALVFLNDGTRYISSFGYGIEQNKAGASLIFEESNSTLINSNAPDRGVYVPGLAAATDGLYAANYDAQPSLHFLTVEGTWESFSFSIAASRYPVRLTADFYGNVWMGLDPERGGGIVVFNRESGEDRHLTNQDQQGELPSNSVYALAVDRDGNVWVGTDAGVAYFFDARSDAIKPLFENRFLLRDEKVTSIAVDGGNRKWIGTERGVWLFNPTGEEALAYFTTANSPLLSDTIVDIEIHPMTGEVFFATEKGVVSFRSDATVGSDRFNEVKIFPNPVTDAWTGLVGITGLATDAVVKITDVSGRLLWQTQANGGTASWNVRDHKGNRVKTGIYLVYALKPDGSESIVGKVAVVN